MSSGRQSSKCIQQAQNQSHFLVTQIVITEIVSNFHRYAIKSFLAAFSHANIATHGGCNHFIKLVAWQGEPAYSGHSHLSELSLSSECIHLHSFGPQFQFSLFVFAVSKKAARTKQAPNKISELPVNKCWPLGYHSKQK